MRIGKKPIGEIKGGLLNPGDPFSKFRSQGYRNVVFDCKVHGVITENEIVLFRDLAGVETYHCSLCYMGWIRKNVPALQPEGRNLISVDEATKSTLDKFNKDFDEKVKDGE